jgi:hypothetical protein
MPLSSADTTALLRLLDALLDPERARVIVPPSEAASGFWFGGGNLAEDEDGTLWLVGRYRDAGDARTGVRGGIRGRELALFRSDDRGATFTRVRGWSKDDLARDEELLSIEGSSLRRRGDGTWELFVSSEKRRAYPGAYAAFQKPGTGVWTIDRMTGPAPDRLDAATLAPAVVGSDPGHLHVKDPVHVERADGGTSLLISNHPLTWASSNTGLAVRAAGGDGFVVTHEQLVPRGPCWDVGVTRLTDRLRVPRVGRFAAGPDVSLLCYDGAEAMAPLAGDPERPRGFSCEELGGAMWAPGDDLAAAQRLTLLAPRFLSPHGTRSARYVRTLTTREGVLATWQQAQQDGSQPLVLSFLEHAEVARLLA